MDSSSKLSDFAFGRQATAKYRGYPSNSRLPVTSAKAAKPYEEAAKSQDPLPQLDKEATSKEIKEAMSAVGPEIAEHISKEDKKKMKNLLDGKQEGSGSWMNTDKMKEVATSKKGKMGMAVIGLLIVVLSMDRYLVPLAKSHETHETQEEKCHPKTEVTSLLQARDVHDLAIEESRQGSKTHSLLAERLGPNHPSVSQFGSWDMCHASYSLIQSLLSFSTHAKQETPPPSRNSMSMFFEGHEEEDSIEEWEDDVGEDAKGEDVFSCDEEEEEEEEETEEDRDFIDDSVEIEEEEIEETDVEEEESTRQEKEPPSHPTKRRRVVVFEHEEDE